MSYLPTTTLGGEAANPELHAENVRLLMAREAHAPVEPRQEPKKELHQDQIVQARAELREDQARPAQVTRRHGRSR